LLPGYTGQSSSATCGCAGFGAPLLPHQIFGRHAFFQLLPTAGAVEHDESESFDLDLVGEGIIVAVLELHVGAADRA
jgi:hypothetical protein